MKLLSNLLTITATALLAWIPTATQAAEVFYDLELQPVLGTRFSPDCQNVQEQRRWLFLAKDKNSNSTTDEFSTIGPLIEANEGDTVVVRVTNQHDALAASLHFHGIHQRGTPWSDGPATITECGLLPHQTQEYRFEAYPPGTHYWHGHLGLDMADGLTGPLIVHPKSPEPFAYDYEDEHTVFLQDFYTETGEQQAAGLKNWPFTWIGNPDSLLINGKGLAPKCDATEEGSDFGNPFTCLDTCDDLLSWLPKLTVKPNKTYRLRIINSSQLTMQNVAITGHKMSIVEVEGTVIDPPVEVENYDLAPGQRVSVLITTDQMPENYLVETTVRERDIPGLTGRLILQYDSVSLSLPTESPDHPEWDASEVAKNVEDSLRTFNASDYEESIALSVDEEDLQRYVLVGTQNFKIDEQTGETTQLRWAVNNISNIATPEPILGQAVRVARRAQSWPVPLGGATVDIPQTPPTTWNYTEPVLGETGPGGTLGQEGAAVIRVKQGEVLELVLQNARALNGAAEFHPWHIHGNSFWVVGRGEGVFDETMDPASYNLNDPLLRDTATLWPLGWTSLRMVANNPGAWYFHCHLASHLVMGMSLTIIVEPNVVEDPPESIQYCARDQLLEKYYTQINSDDGDNGMDDQNFDNSDSSATRMSLIGSIAISIFSFIAAALL